MAVHETRYAQNDIPLEPDDVDMRVLDKLWSRADEQALFESATRGPAMAPRQRYVPMLEADDEDAQLFDEIMK
jgi:hypothetical protein